MMIYFLRKNLVRLLLTIITAYACSSVPQVQEKETYQPSDRFTRKIYDRSTQFITKTRSGEIDFFIPYETDIDKIHYSKKKKWIHIYFNKKLSYRDYREHDVELFYRLFKQELGRKFRKYNLHVYSMGIPLKDLIPNIYRNKTKQDTTRMGEVSLKRTFPLVRRVHPKYDITKGLYNRYIALWHSHGWYYNNEKERWEWSRPRLFQTVEDVFTLSYTIPYLLPMLENAGATVMMPRERDPQTHEVIIDNDSEVQRGIYEEKGGLSRSDDYSGYAVGNPPYTHENPFKLGTYVTMISDTLATVSISWDAEIPEAGEYAVYVSYHHSDENIEDARYTVYHAAGKDDYFVNQTIGGETWIYLGTFPFSSDSPSKVTLTNESRIPYKLITADAVKFGGGMGNVARGGRTSKRAKFFEGARYYLQTAGMPDTLVYSLHADTLDYNDDYKCRGEWVNYLLGNPYGPNKNRDFPGLEIPVDISFAFHSDAGISNKNENIGTLAIYSVDDMDSSRVYPDGRSRLAARDLADIVQTDLVSRLRKQYEKNWPRRSLVNGMYSEVARPNIPAMILEFLSHQNLEDLKYGLDPQFHFDVSRSIYVSLLKYISYQNGFDYVVQPLPVKFMSTKFNTKGELILEWQAVEDPFEKTAMPNRYIVYTKKDEAYFNSGNLVYANEFVIKNPEPGTIYSFKVEAVNEGGVSFPSEIISACKMDSTDQQVLIINGFDRIAAPETMELNSWSGFMNTLDEGVPYMKNFSFTGGQYNYFINSAYKDNDSPGHGGSRSDYDTRILTGNTFDYPYIHGKALRSAGYSFVSASDESIESGNVSLGDYFCIDLICGEEKSSKISHNSPTRFPVMSSTLMDSLTRYLNSGGNLLASGAYIASDLYNSENAGAKKFAKEILKVQLNKKNAVNTGDFFSTDSWILNSFLNYHFNSDDREDIYKVEAPDALLPVEGESKTILRFSENHFSAATAHFDTYGVIVMSIPFETIIDESNRNMIMSGFLKYFDRVK